MASITPGHYIVGVLGNVTLTSAIDDGLAPGGDPVDAPLTILPNNPSAGIEAFQLEVRPNLANGFINLIVTTP